MNIRLPIITILTVCSALWAMPGVAQGQTPTPTPTLLVIFSLPGTGAAISPVALNNPDVYGISIRQAWSDLEPAQGVYNWSYLDQQIKIATAAGKKVTLRVVTGGGAASNGGCVPNWVMAQVGPTFSWFSLPVGGAERTIPVFWDEAFLSRKCEMLAALGARYSSNPAVAIVYVGFANANSMDWNVPTRHAVDDIPPAGSSEHTRWLLLGYTSAKMVAAGDRVVTAAANAFPNASIVYAVGRASSDTIDPTKDYVPQTVLNDMQHIYGLRIGIQKNDLSTVVANTEPYSAQPTDNLWEIMFQNPPSLGAQMLGQFYGDDGTAYQLQRSIQTGVSYKTRYQEIYEQDIIHFPSVIHYSRGLVVP